MTRTRRALALVSLAFFAVAASPVVAAPVVWEGNGHSYQVIRVGTPLTWDNARARAQALGPGWDLATITSADENAFVAKLLPFFSSDIFQPLSCSGRFPYICFYLGPWIGGFNVTAPNTFQWVTGEPVSYTNWPQGFLVPAGRQIAYELSWNLDFDSTSVYWETPAADGVRPIAYVAEHRQTQELLFLTQTTVAGCKTVTGTVLLPRPAPSAGVVVNLSDTLRSASTPLTLRIPAGASRGTFTITTTPVTAPETGTVRATLGSTTLTKQLTVRPMGVASLALAISAGARVPRVVGGLKTIGEATLECQAGPGPITVKLDSSRPALAYPVAASISVPQAAKSASFEVATNVVLSTQSAKITATANGIAQSMWLTVDRAPTVEPNQISFGSVPVGTTAPTRSVTLSNNGGPFSISSIGITGPYASWFAQTNNCGATLNAWASCTIRVTFKPLASGGGWASLSIATGATSTPIGVGLTGTGTTAN